MNGKSGFLFRKNAEKGHVQASGGGHVEFLAPGFGEGELCAVSAGNRTLHAFAAGEAEQPVREGEGDILLFQIFDAVDCEYDGFFFQADFKFKKEIRNIERAAVLILFEPRKTVELSETDPHDSVFAFYGMFRMFAQGKIPAMPVAELKRSIAVPDSAETLVRERETELFVQFDGVKTVFNFHLISFRLKVCGNRSGGCL